MTKFSILLLALIFLVNCNRNDEERIEPLEYKVEKTDKNILIASNDFGCKSFSSIVLRKPHDNNVITSPINFSLGMNVLLYASGNKNEKYIKQLLGINFVKEDEINKGFDRLNQVLTEIDEYTKMSGENLFEIADNINVSERFEKFVNDRKYSRLIKNNSNLKSGAKDVMIKPGSMNLSNSFNLTASLKNQRRIEKQPFYNSPNESSFIEMIVTGGYYNYYNDITLQAVEIPLGRGNFNILLLVPKGTQTINELVKKLDPRLIKRVISKCKKQAIEVYLPKLDLLSAESYKEVFAKDRIRNFFTPRKSDFTKIDENTKVYLSDIEQTISFKLEENPLISSNSAIENNNDAFLVDNPFVFVVYEKYSNAIVLLGKISQL